MKLSYLLRVIESRIFLQEPHGSCQSCAFNTQHLRQVRSGKASRLVIQSLAWQHSEPCSTRAQEEWRSCMRQKASADQTSQPLFLSSRTQAVHAAAMRHTASTRMQTSHAHPYRLRADQTGQRTFSSSKSTEAGAAGQCHRPVNTRTCTG